MKIASEGEEGLTIDEMDWEQEDFDNGKEENAKILLMFESHFDMLIHTAPGGIEND